MPGWDNLTGLKGSRQILQCAGTHVTTYSKATVNTLLPDRKCAFDLFPLSHRQQKIGAVEQIWSQAVS